MAPSSPLQQRLIHARDELDRLVRTMSIGSAESLRESFPDVWNDPDLALELVYAEFVTRENLGQAPDRVEWLRRYPQWRDRLERLFSVGDLFSEGPLAEAWPDHEISDDHPPGYSFLEIIGHGASAVVYKARQESLNRLVAVKVFHESTASAKKRITREGELAARLQHPNIVPIYEVGEWKGQPFLTMEYVSGGTLSPERTRASSLHQIATLMESIARAVHCAHSMGVVHRDLKPSNVLMTQDGTPKIADFGLAMTFDSQQSVTESIALAGTPCYMAPEQAQGQTARVGPRSDVYSLGAMLYELLTGRPPFHGNSIIETLDLVRNAEPERPRQIRASIPRDLETISLQCLQKDPGRRYATAADLANDLQRFRTGQAIQARPVTALEHAWKWMCRHPAIATLSLALFIALASAIVAQTMNYRNAEAARLKEQQLNHDLQQSFAEQSIGAARALWNGGQLAALRQTLDQCPPQFRTSDWHGLDRLCNAHVGCWTGPEYAASKLAVSRDGSRLALRRRTGARTIDFLDMASGTLQFSIPSVFPLQMEFTEDGKSLVMIQAIAESATTPFTVAEVMQDNLSREVVIWDLETESITRRWTLPGRGGSMNRGGSRVASWHDNTIFVWDTGSGKMIAEFTQAASQRLLARLAISDDGLKLAVRHGSEDIHIWDVPNNRRERTFAAGPALSMGTFLFQADGQRLYSFAGQLGTKPAEATMRPFIHAWDVASGRVSFQIPGRVPVVLATSPNGKLLAHLNNRAIDLYDASTGSKKATLMGHSDQIASIAFSHDSKRLYSGALDNTLRTWDISSWAE